jgi:hypothetical protein
VANPGDFSLGEITMNKNAAPLRAGIGAWAIGLLCVAGPGYGAIIEWDAAVSTTVQELIDGIPASVTSDSDALDATGSNLPLKASGDLTSTDLEGKLVSMGQAFSAFTDPTISDDPNPEEFSIEVGGYSNTVSVGYTVAGEAWERRTLVFTTPGSSVAPPEIDFGTGSTREVESRIYLSGAVLFWSTAPGTSLDDMRATLDVIVVRDEDEAVMFESSLEVLGAGTDEVSTSSTGPVVFEVVGLDELADQGIDEDSLAILEQIEQQGTLIVLVIPEQEHPYTYTVTADEPFDLTATLGVNVRNVPEGTGVAATWGAPFENLAAFIEQGLPGVSGASIEQSVNKVIEARAIGLVPAYDGPSMQARSPLCGALGLEFAVMATLALCLTLTRPCRP